MSFLGTHPSLRNRLIRSLTLTACCILGGWGITAETPTVVSSSTAYTMESTAKITVAASGPQVSGLYDISPTSDNKANNGLAIGSSGKMSLSWPVSSDPKLGLGYEVSTSTNGKNDSYIDVNATPIAAPPYEIQYHQNGKYYYIVYFIELNGARSQVTDPFWGMITDILSAKNWDLYE